MNNEERRWLYLIGSISTSLVIAGFLAIGEYCFGVKNAWTLPFFMAFFMATIEWIRRGRKSNK